MVQRAQKKIQRFRHLMHGYMLSPKDAFHQYDPDRTGFLTFPAFSRLIHKLCELAIDPVPSFAVLKDIFNLIDHRKDDLIDLNEWNSVFGGANNWEDSKQFEQISRVISRNRKVILLNASSGILTFADTKAMLENVLQVRNLDDAHWRQVLRVADAGGGLVDIRKLLEIYKGRDGVRRMHPRPLTGNAKSSARSFTSY
jgi:Ca2+-binding EF-hand superfamily protein